jgi:CRISPR-associated protein Cas1
MLTYPDFEQKQILFVLLSYGEKISFKNDNIVIADCDGKIKHQSTCYKLMLLFIVGHITITSGLLQKSSKFGFSIILLSHNLKFIGIWQSKTDGNVLLRKKQYEYDKLDLAFHIVENKIQNQIQALQSIRNKEETVQKAQNYLTAQIKLLKETADIDLQKLLGFEGICSRVYFKEMFSQCNWTSRKPRVKADIINCLLDIGYTILFNVVESLLNVYGFDIYKGVYHRNFYQRKSLVCDLIEPFRPIIDMQIRKSFNLKQIKEDDFLIIQEQYNLFGEKSKPYMLWLLEPILKYKKEMFLYVQQYYRAFMRNKNAADFPVFNILKD